MTISLVLITLSYFEFITTPVAFNFYSTEVAHHSTANEATFAAAKKAFDEGWQLYQQGTAESLQQAIVKWEEALNFIRTLGDQKAEGNTLHNIAAVYKNLGQVQKALEYYNQALPLRRAAGDREGEAETLNNLGVLYDELGEKQKALEYYNQALPIRRAVRDQEGEALTINNIGAIYGGRGEGQKALEYYNQALLLYREVGDRAGEATTLNNIGVVHSNLGEKQKALEYYNQVLPIRRTLGDSRGEAITLNNIGNIYDDLGEKQKALEYYNQALPLHRQAGNPRGEASLLNNIAFIYNFLGERQKAIEYYNQALPIFKAVGDRGGEATTLNNLGSAYNFLGERQQAIAYYNQALPLFREVEDRGGEATTLNNLGHATSALGKKQKALEYYNRALPIHRAVGNKGGEATTLNNIGGIYDELGEKQKAIDYYNQALPLYRAIGDRDGEAVALSNIGAVYNELGEREKALEYHNQALPLRRAIEDPYGEAVTLNNIGNVYDVLGEKQRAIEYYNQALTLYRAVSDRNGEAITLNNIGTVYDVLGEKQQAIAYYNQALTLYRAVEDLGGEATALNNLGFIYEALGDKEKALEYYNQALPIRRTVEDKGGEAVTLNNIGAIYGDLGKQEQALEYYNQALTLYRAVGNRGGEANTLNNIGIIYNALGDKEKGLEYLNQALSLHRQLGNRGEEANALWNLAQLEYEQGNLLIAAEHMEQAIEQIEFLRNQIINPELQGSFYLTVEGYYDFYIRLLMELQQQNPSSQYHSQALHYSERVRARQLLTELKESQVDIRQGVDRQLVQEEEKLTKQLAINLENQAQILRRGSSNREKENLNQEINSLITQLNKVEATIRLQSPGYAAINQPTKFTLQTRDIQEQILDDDTIVLEYYLSDEVSYLWVVSKEKVSSYELPAKKEIEKLAEAFRKDIASETENNPEIAKQLSNILLAPAMEELENKRLLIVGDGTLQSIPFAALTTPNSSSPPAPLITNHEIITLPSVSSLAALRQQVKNRPLAPRKLAVLADPVYELNESSQEIDLSDLSGVRAAQNACLSLQNLPYTRTEAENILALVPEEESFAALGHNASLATATNSQLSQYQTIHFATHGCLNKDVPQFSGLALSAYNSQAEPQDPLLRLDTIYNLVLPAELVVLSACETGLGEELAGEGLVSLTRGFMYAGAKRVVVSFWAVNDSSTAELMSKFYEKMYKDNLKPGAALRKAQLEMWESGEAWQDPYYWAAFNVQGEW